MSTPYEPHEQDTRAEQDRRYSWDRPEDGRDPARDADRGVYGVGAQGGHAPAPYQQAYGMAAAQEGQRAGQLAIAFGVIGLFFNLGLIFGPLAIWQANRAESVGGVGLGGRVLGWVAIGLAILVTLFFIVYGVIIFTMLQTMSTELGNEFSTRS